MKTGKLFIYIAFAGILASILFFYHGCRSARIAPEYSTDTLYTNTKGKGDLLEISFRRGPEHNHPLMAVWVEDTTGQFIQTLYVAESIAKGVFGHGDKSAGKWLPGPIRRPAALPVWSHHRGVREADGLYVPTQGTTIPDAYTGATPQENFVLYARTDSRLPDKFDVFFEINQTWDWNNYWTNNKYPDDDNYKTSCQPALVYRSRINSNAGQQFYKLELVGHSHYSGENGDIYSDLSTITTAKEITESVYVRLIQ